MGHDVLTIQETGRAEDAVPDADVLAYATDLDRAVLTHNRRDFVRLHLASTNHAGIVVFTFDPDFPTQAQRIHEALTGEGNLRGKLVRVRKCGDSLPISKWAQRPE